MRFREHQASARSTTRRLVLLFVLTIALTVLGVNAALWLAWRLVVMGLFNTPPLFYEANTAITLLFVLGGWWLESLQLKKGGAHVAQWLGGRELTTPRDLAERRLRNVVHEMAIASGLPMPRVFVLDREDTINAFASGWEASDSAITLGSTSRMLRATPIVASASISSVTRMTPICAVIAEPERPATSTATNTGPSSRTIETPRILTINKSAPKFFNCKADK